MSQIALPLAWPEHPRDDAFLVTPTNARAAQLLDHWDSWPVYAALLTGPRRSGRSLLARIFAAKSGGSIIDDADRVSETSLFHAWNRAQADRRPLVLIADVAPPVWRITLPDLRSRLAATPHAEIGPPDDRLVRALFERQLARRGVVAPPDVLEWLVARIERNHLTIERSIDALDEGVMERQRRLTIPLARTTLIDAGLLPAQQELP